MSKSYGFIEITGVVDVYKRQGYGSVRTEIIRKYKGRQL